MNDAVSETINPTKELKSVKGQTFFYVFHFSLYVSVFVLFSSYYDTFDDFVAFSFEKSFTFFLASSVSY